MESKLELKYIFANVNEWLKFAEAKHGGLIILNSGLVIGLLSCYINIQNFNYKIPILIGVISFGLSVFLSILSQFPQTQNVFYNKKNIPNPNLYFFGHLAYMDIEQCITEFQNIDASFVATKLDKDILNQILINARITETKYSIFKFASYLTSFGIGIIGLGSIIKIICHL